MTNTDHSPRPDATPDAEEALRIALSAVLRETKPEKRSKVIAAWRETGYRLLDASAGHNVYSIRGGGCALEDTPQRRAERAAAQALLNVATREAIAWFQR